MKVTLDPRLTWRRHLNTIKKNVDVAMLLARLIYMKTLGLIAKPMITYVSLVWLPNMKKLTVLNRRRQGTKTCLLGIVEAMRTTPIPALDPLNSLHLLITEEARMAQFKLENSLFT